MSKFTDLSGQIFERLTVLKRVENDKQGNVVYLVSCQCKDKTVKKVRAFQLKSGHTKSCGCLIKENLKMNPNNKTHGASQTRLYNIWSKMKARCDNKNTSGYKDYGGRCISYTKEWATFEPFKYWAEKNGYQDDLTIERNDVNGNYEPDNCSWIPFSEQVKNKRTNVRISYKDEVKILTDWAKDFDVPESTIKRWYEEGIHELRFDELSEGLRRKTSDVLFEYKGEVKNLTQWAKHFNIGATTVSQWNKKGILKQKFDILSNGTKLKKNEPVFIEYKGEVKRQGQWAKHFNVSGSTIANWNKKDIIEEEFDKLVAGIIPSLTKGFLFSYKGETKNLTQWAETFGISKRTVRSWHEKGILKLKFDQINQ